MVGFNWSEGGQRFQRTIFYVLIVFILVSSAYSAGPDVLAFFHTPPLADNMVTFDDRGLGLAIKYPSNWERSKIGQDQVTFIHSTRK